MRARMLCLFDGSPEALACALVAQRIASGLDIALTITAPPPTAPSRARARLAPSRELLRARLAAFDDCLLAVSVPWRGDGRKLRRLVAALPFPLLTVAPDGALRLQDGVAVSERIVLCVADPRGDTAATHRVAAAAAAAMDDWLAVMNAARFCRDPAAVGGRVELVVTGAAALDRRPMRRALRSAAAPLLIVPSGGDRAWPPQSRHAQPPLTVVR